MDTKYDEAVEKQLAQRYLTSLRNKTLKKLKSERQAILDRIICFELYYGELNRDMNRAIRAENWTDVILIRRKFRENSDDRLELIQYDSVIKEKERLKGLRVVQ